MMVEIETDLHGKKGEAYQRSLVISAMKCPVYIRSATNSSVVPPKHFTKTWQMLPASVASHSMFPNGELSLKALYSRCLNGNNIPNTNVT